MLVLAQEAASAPAAAPAQNSAPAGGGLSSFLIFIPIFGLMYFLMIRPQQKKQKQVQEMLRQLKAGDKVMLNSGALGIGRCVEIIAHMFWAGGEAEDRSRSELRKNKGGRREPSFFVFPERPAAPRLPARG